MQWETNTLAKLKVKFEKLRNERTADALSEVEILLTQLERVQIKNKDGVEETIRNLFEEYHRVVTPGIEIIMIKLLEKLTRTKREEVTQPNG